MASLNTTPHSNNDFLVGSRWELRKTLWGWNHLVTNRASKKTSSHQKIIKRKFPNPRTIFLQKCTFNIFCWLMKLWQRCHHQIFVVDSCCTSLLRRCSQIPASYKMKLLMKFPVSTILGFCVSCKGCIDEWILIHGGSLRWRKWFTRNIILIFVLVSF